MGLISGVLLIIKKPQQCLVESKIKRQNRQYNLIDVYPCLFFHIHFKVKNKQEINQNTFQDMPLIPPCSLHLYMRVNMYVHEASLRDSRK